MKKLFEHTLLMSGGSSRFGYYLGMYAAAVEANRRPDAIFATCGGAIAAGIVSSFCSIKEQKEALLSHEIHQMFLRCYANKNQSLLNVLLGVGYRYFNRHVTAVFPDFYRHAVFNIDNSQPFFPFTPQYASTGLDVAIIGSRLCFNRDQIGMNRGSAALFEEVVFSNEKTLNALSNISRTTYSPLIKNDLVKESAISLQEAIRISISDIYYLPPYEIGDISYMGGMLDLVPFHLAQHCSNRVSLEHKKTFSKLSAVPAFLHVLGYNPNHALKNIPYRPQDTWIDTVDALNELKNHQIKKHVSWLLNKITIETPTYDQFRNMMKKQWDYGYHKALYEFNQALK